MQSGHISNFKHLSQFSSLKDFNNNIEQWMVDLKSSFTKSELIALKRLIRFAAKIPGICNAKVQTIVAATHEKNEMGGISRSTFERMLRKAKLFGMLRIENTKKYGRQGHNVYIFIPYVSQEILSTGSVEVVENQSIDGARNSLSFESNNNFKDIRTQDAEASKLASEILPSWIETDFGKYACIFYSTSDVIEFARIALINRKNYDIDSSEVHSISLQAFQQLVYKTKHGKVKNPFGMFTTILRQRLRTAEVRGWMRAVY